MVPGLDQLLLTGIGVIVVGGVWLDFMATAMTASATGILSRRFCYWLHRLFDQVAQLARSPRLRGAAGPCLTLSLIVMWFGLSWVGWSFIYLGTEGTAPSPDIPLDMRGTAFQIQVWQFLTSIREGEVRSYGQVAEAIGKPRAIRAVASACARNRIGLLIPCHRVLRADGQLGGYRWGLERKRALLSAERNRNSERL